jgi:hypothetical protein
MRSNRLRFRYTNDLNDGFWAAVLGVTNTMLASSTCRSASHLRAVIPIAAHLTIMSCRNATNGTTTIVKPRGDIYAGNWNNKLFPSPVGITAMILSAPSTIACATSLYTPRNLAAPDLIICYKPVCMFAPCKCFYLAACFASITASHSASLVFLFPFVCVPSLPSWLNAVSKPNHKCHM